MCVYACSSHVLVQVIKGWDQGCLGMQRGEIRQLVIPAAEARAQCFCLLSAALAGCFCVSRQRKGCGVEMGVYVVYDNREHGGQ